MTGKSEKQQEFDWQRARRIDWLDHLVIPPFDRIESDGSIRTVRTDKLKQVLVMLERFERSANGWSLSERKLALALGGPSVRTVRRRIDDCEFRGLLEVRREEGKENKYFIVWSEVAQILLDDPRTAAKVQEPYVHKLKAMEEARRPTNESDDLTPDNFAQTPDSSAATPDNFAQTPDSSADDEGDDTTSSRARGLQPCLQPCSQPEIKPCSEIGDLSFQGVHGWPFRIERQHLQQPVQIQRLWEHALDNNYVLADCRMRFFRLAICVSQRPDVRNHGGFFTKRVSQRKWLGADHHTRWAIEQILKLDGRDVRPKDEPPSKGVAEAIEKLRKRFGMEDQG